MAEELKIGDKVRIKKGSNWNDMGLMDKYLGREVIINKISPSHYFFEGSDDWYFGRDSFILLKKEKTMEKSEEFNIEVGDTIEITKGFACWNELMDKFVGRQFIVTSSNKGSKTINFNGDDSWSWYWDKGHFKLIRKACTSPLPTSTPLKTKFSIRDWVTILKGDGDWVSNMDKFVGRTVEITNTRDEGNIINFEDDGGWVWSYNKGHFRLATKDEILGGKDPIKDSIKNGDSFSFPEMKGIIHKSSMGWFWGCSGSNSYAFTKLKVDRYEYQKRVLGYTTESGGFPYCKTAEDLLKLLNKLKEDIEALSAPKSAKAASTSYSEGDVYSFSGKEGYLKQASEGWYWNPKSVSDVYYDYPFTLLDVPPQEFQKKILGYSNSSGCFPWCKTLEDLVKLCQALTRELNTRGIFGEDQGKVEESKPQGEIAPSKSIYTSKTGRIKPVIIKVRKI